MTICPCCGFKFEGELKDGCEQCGARAVGEALPRPAYELPSYGRSLVLFATGLLTVIVFLAQTIGAFVQHYSGSFGFWTWIAAGETAAWHLRWISLPVMMLILWCGIKLYRSIRNEPERFCGLTYARRGLLSSTVVGLLIAVLLAVTIPARLEQRRIALDAKQRAVLLELDRALFELKMKHRTLPTQEDAMAELKKLPDPDGSLAAALKDFDPNNYQPRAEVAAVSGQKRTLRGAIIKNASFTPAVDDSSPGGLTFTSYELLLPGEDKIVGTDDDLVSRDGIISRLKDVAKGGVGRSLSAGALQP